MERESLRDAYAEFLDGDAEATRGLESAQVRPVRAAVGGRHTIRIISTMCFVVE